MLVTTGELERNRQGISEASSRAGAGLLSPMDSGFIRRRVERLYDMSSDLLDDIDARLRASLGMEQDASDAVVTDRARMHVVNYRTKNGE